MMSGLVQIYKKKISLHLRYHTHNRSQSEYCQVLLKDLSNDLGAHSFCHRYFNLYPVTNIFDSSSLRKQLGREFSSKHEAQFIRREKRQLVCTVIDIICSYTFFRDGNI